MDRRSVHFWKKCPYMDRQSIHFWKQIHIYIYILCLSERNSYLRNSPHNPRTRLPHKPSHIPEQNPHNACKADDSSTKLHPHNATAQWSAQCSAQTLRTNPSAQGPNNAKQTNFLRYDIVPEFIGNRQIHMCASRLPCLTTGPWA